ncbi:MAG: hypothetical protein ABIG68_14815 [Acidobacteriota bacterium]
MHQEKVQVSREDFEAFVELVGAETVFFDWRAKVDVYFELENGVKVRLNGTLLYHTALWNRYGRPDAVDRYGVLHQEWTHVLIDANSGSAFNRFGQGARSSETSQEITVLHTILANA